jgi:hypothetical protein
VKTKAFYKKTLFQLEGSSYIPMKKTICSQV